MIKRFWCWFFGHDTVRKAYTGEIMQTTNYLGQDVAVALYKWERLPFCLRCGSVKSESTKV